MEKGSWVVCVDDSNWNPEVFNKMSLVPEKGVIYQVREVMPPIPGLTDEFGIKLEESRGESDLFSAHDGRCYWIEYHFRAERFRELSRISYTDALYSLIEMERAEKKKAVEVATAD